MSEWREVKLGDVCENISRPFDFTNKEKVIFINTGDVLNGKFLHFNYSNKDTLPGQAKKAISKEDILFSEIRPKNKRFVYVDFDDTSYFVVSTKFMVLKSNKKLILPKFLYLLITSPIYLNIFQTIAESRSGTFPQITFSSISNVKIKLPPLSIQKKIADILSIIDEKIETLQNINETLEEMAKAIFKSWFVDFDIVKAKEEGKSDDEIAKEFGISKEIVKLFPSEFVESEIGKIPKGWEVKKLEELIFKANTGADAIKKAPIVDYDTGIRCVRVGDFSNNRNFSEWGFADVNEKVFNTYKLEKNDILITRTSFIGLSKIIRQNLSAVYNNGLIRIKPKNNAEYLYFNFQSPQFKNYINRISGETSTRQNMKINYLLDYKIIIPDKYILKIINNFLNMILDNIESNTHQIHTLQELRDTLLPKLINGEIEVDELDVRGIE